MAPASDPIPRGFTDAERAFMEAALVEARAAYAADEVPVGAVLVAPATGPGETGRIVAADHNLTRGAADPSAHAELLAIRRAARAFGTERLTGCVLYTTLEPCLMCAGALLHARLARAVFGARDPKFGGVVSLAGLLDLPGANHRVPWDEGLLAQESSALLRAFFRPKRGDEKSNNAERWQSG